MGKYLSSGMHLYNNFPFFALPKVLLFSIINTPATVCVFFNIDFSTYNLLSSSKSTISRLNSLLSNGCIVFKTS